MVEESNHVVKNNEQIQSFYESIKSELDIYVDKWKLRNLEIIDDGRESCVLKCFSEIYGDAILKKRTTSKIIEDEYNTLVEYNGKRFCKAYDADSKNGILLEEQIKPGIELKEIASLDERLTVFCNLHKGLHITPKSIENYPTYLDWVSNATSYMESQKDYNTLYLHMKKAEEICKELFELYPTKMLLHGDLHHHNILFNHSGNFKIIDPKGVIGDPIFDIPRFILNEMEENINLDLFHKINYIITFISNWLLVPSNILRKLFYMEMVMADCWNVQDGNLITMDNVIFAEKILNY
jgi:streptomycin 6-kinase